MLRRLDRIVALDPGRPEIADDRRQIRDVTRQVAFDPGRWTPERAAHVATLFDGLAPGWNERPAAGRLEAVDDALARGGPFPAGPALEVGAGTGQISGRLATRLTPLVSVDLSAAMLALAPAALRRIRADASSLPVASGSVAVVALVNMFLFPTEVDRVLAPRGLLLWVNTQGEDTPIYLPAEDVAAALPGDWDGVASQAGWGTWSTFRRAAPPAPA